MRNGLPKAIDAVNDPDMPRVTESHLIANGWWTEQPSGGGRKPNADSPFAKALNAEVPTEFASLSDDEVIAKITSLTEPMLPISSTDESAEEFPPDGTPGGGMETPPKPRKKAKGAK